MAKSHAKKIVVLAVFVALTAAFYPIPFCFLIPVILASIWFDFVTATVLSLALGVISYAFSFLGGSPLSLAFIRFPWIAILPRIAVGPLTRAVYLLLRRLLRGRESAFWRMMFPAAIAGGTGALCNTALVLGMFSAFGADVVLGEVALTAMLATWAVSGVIEIVVNLVATPIVDATCRKVLLQTSLKTGR